MHRKSKILTKQSQCQIESKTSNNVNENELTFISINDNTSIFSSMVNCFIKSLL